MVGRVRVFIASSLDGFIAGRGDELDWLDGHEGAEDTFTPFLAEVGALLMGHRTWDVVDGTDGPWFYGETPVLVATSRQLEVSRVAGAWALLEARGSGTGEEGGGCGPSCSCRRKGLDPARNGTGD